MKIQEKPDYLIFADSAKNGECANFPDVSRGWGVTIDQTASKPPLEWMNGAFNRIDKNALYLLQQGVPEWSEKVIYPANAIIKYNGVLYTAVVENDNTKPSTNTTKWKKTIAEVPTASTEQKGAVKLSSATNSTSETEAATPKAVKSAYDTALSAQQTANTAKSIAETNASTTTAGRVKLNSAINSTSETEAATPKAIKTACDLLNGSVKKTGDTMTGQLILPKDGVSIKFENNDVMALATSNDDYSHIFYNAQKKQWFKKLVYNSTTNRWNFQYIDDVTINNKSVLKTGDYGIGSFTGAQLENPDETLLGGCYATRTTKFPELTEFQNRNDSGSLVVYPAWTKGWSVEKLAVVQGKTPRVFYRCSNPEFKQPFNEVITTANINKYLPVGVPLPWPKSTPPDGWLKCNGWKFDTNKYPKLAQAYTSGYLPELRGEFIRGWDDARGVDPNRVILSYQGDAIRNITGNVWPISETFGRNGGTGDGAFRAFDIVAAGTPTSTDRGESGGFSFDASRVVPVAHENRPRSVAFMYIVKAE